MANQGPSLAQPARGEGSYRRGLAALFYDNGRGGDEGRRDPVTRGQGHRDRRHQVLVTAGEVPWATKQALREPSTSRAGHPRGEQPAGEGSGHERRRRPLQATSERGRPLLDLANVVSRAARQLASSGTGEGR